MLLLGWVFRSSAHKMYKIWFFIEEIIVGNLQLRPYFQNQIKIRFIDLILMYSLYPPASHLVFIQFILLILLLFQQSLEHYGFYALQNKFIIEFIIY